MPATLVFGAAVEDPTDTFTYTAATLEVAPGTYTLAELAVAGYEPTAWSCTNGGGGAFDAGTVTVVAGDDPVTCSITNDDEPVELTIVKTVINDDGGTAVVDDFGITTDAGDTDLHQRRRHAHDRLHRRRPSTSPPARTPSPSSRWPATSRPPGPAPTATAAPSTPARSPSWPATTR